MKAFFSTPLAPALPPGHRFPAAKYALLREALARELPALHLQVAEPAGDDELTLVHAPAYVKAVAEGTLDARALREIGWPWSPAMAERARRSVGATLAASRVALQEGVAANLAGGTHHAHAARGSGYCVFNDIAVAARATQLAHVHRHPGARRPRVAVIDLDVHQGDGTAAIFADDASVFTLSLHGEKNFPFRKAASDLDVALPDGTGDAAYLAALDGALEALAERFAPELLYFIAGADAHEADRLGRLKLTHAGLRERDERVFAWAWARRLPLVLTLGGGYGRDLATTIAAQLGTFGAALAHWRRWQNVAR